MSAKTELVSVVIPAFNAGHTIVQAVESVLAQTYAPIECIVIDDGSTDNIYQQLQSYLPRIIYHRQENQGRSAARNRGINLAQGEYIAFLDADDWWDAEKIALQVAALQKYPTAGLVYTWATLTDAEGNSRSVWGEPEKREFYPHTEIFQDMVWGRHLPGAGSSVMVRRSSLEQIGGFDLDLPTGQDWELTVRFALYYDVACIPQALTYYRNPQANILEKFDRRALQDRQLLMLHKIFARVNDVETREHLQPRAFARACWHGALMDYAMGRLDKARERAVEAWRWLPEFFTGPEQLWAAVFWAVASYLGYSDTIGYVNADLVAHFTQIVFSELPEPLHFLSKQRGRYLAQVYAVNTFKAHRRGDWATVRQCGWKVLRYDSRWLRNLGLLKMCVVSLWRGSR